MSGPFVGEIRMFGGNFPPNGWMFCEGQTLPIAEHDVLFQLIGTTYGGDGEETFNLPDLRGRVPVHTDQGPNTQGELGGVESVTLTVQQIPTHTHTVIASADQGSLPDPGNAVLARSHTAGVFLYLNDAPDVAMHPNSITPVGGSQPHDNLQPYLALHFIISLFGIFPHT